MKPECFLPLWQQHITGPYPKPHEYIPRICNLVFEINFNIIDPSAPRSSKCSIYLFLLKQNSVCTYLLPYMCNRLHLSFWTKGSLYTFTYLILLDKRQSLHIHLSFWTKDILYTFTYPSGQKAVSTHSLILLDKRQSLHIHLSHPSGQKTVSTHSLILLDKRQSLHIHLSHPSGQKAVSTHSLILLDKRQSLHIHSPYENAKLENNILIHSVHLVISGSDVVQSVR
jgi:hypothetical protein